MIPAERAARALCRFDGHPENIKFEGRPMWESYSSQAHYVVAAIQDDCDRLVEIARKIADWDEADPAVPDLSGMRALKREAAALLSARGHGSGSGRRVSAASMR
ncbi:hypothetical protein GCM10009087_19040 [Sphingomonas oligophenolica]